MEQERFIEKSQYYLTNTYARFPVLFVRGKGCYLWDKEGRRYLDFVAGLAVCSLGHSPPRVVKAIRDQAEKLLHVSNLYHIEPQIELARLLVENSFADKVFFCNSGAEANEAAIKLARKFSHDRFGPGRYEIITMEGSFHGRTLATLAATGQKKFHQGFKPLPAGFKYAPFNDLENIEKALSPRSCAIMVEPIQGEGGINIPDYGYLKGLRKICDDHQLLLILDEVQMGMGRTGKLFAYQHYGIKPDILTLAKSLASGFPIGAMLSRNFVAASFTPGTHASTFGGNPLACAAALATLRSINDQKLLGNCRRMGRYLLKRLYPLGEKYHFIKDIRGKGLAVAMELSIGGKEIVSESIKRGLLINCTMERIIRFLPPLNIGKGEIDRMTKILDGVLAQITSH